MTISTGIAKRLVFKQESSFGVDPGPTGAQYLRRVSSDIGLQKDNYQSAELRRDYQVADMRHGMRKVGGTIKDELSCLTFKEFIAAALRGVWVTGVNSTALTNVTAAATAPHFVRAAGSWLTDGFKLGDTIRWSGWTVATANNAHNYRITALTALNMSVLDLNTGLATVVAKASGDTVTATVTGSKVMVPSTGHTNLSYTIEHDYNDIVVSERYNGCRISTIDFDLPSTGMATISIGVMGQNVVTGTTGYFTTPTAETTTPIVAAVNGRLTYNGVDSALITGMSILIDGGLTTGSVIGSNVTPDVFVGRVRVNGNISGYFQDGNIRDDFILEQTPSVTISMSTSDLGAADAFTIKLPKIKLGSCDRDDGEQGLKFSAPFTALLNTAGGAGTTSDATTISIQDSAVV